MKIVNYNSIYSINYILLFRGVSRIFFIRGRFNSEEAEIFSSLADFLPSSLILCTGAEQKSLSKKIMHIFMYFENEAFFLVLVGCLFYNTFKKST